MFFFLDPAGEYWYYSVFIRSHIYCLDTEVLASGGG